MNYGNMHKHTHAHTPTHTFVARDGCLAQPEHREEDKKGVDRYHAHPHSMIVIMLGSAHRQPLVYI